MEREGAGRKDRKEEIERVRKRKKSKDKGMREKETHCERQRLNWIRFLGKHMYLSSSL